MPNRRKGRAISYGKRRQRAIEEYLSAPIPIQDNNTEQLFTPAVDETFVPLFHYKKPHIKNQGERIGEQSHIYIVSNRGNVISFDIPRRPVVLKKSLTLKEREDMSYLKCGDNWDIHKAVWFSFAADAIIHNKELPRSYGIHESFWTLDGLVELAELGSPECGKLIIVHHMDENPQNNNLENLELLPNNEDSDSTQWHSWMHSLDDKTDEERLKAIVANRKIRKPTIMGWKNDTNNKETFLAEIDQQSTESINQEKINDLRWKMLFNGIISDISSIVDQSYFSEPRYGFIEKDGSVKSIVVTKNDADTDYIIDYEPIRDDADYDFIYRDGKTWLPKLSKQVSPT